MDSRDYKDKIRKLLALAESPNEHEAKAALLKARELMAEHKLTEAELKDAEKQEVKNVRVDITCSKKRNPWIVHLSGVIGENYCCKGYRCHGYGRQTQVLGFIGLEDDVEICVEIFKYAVDCALTQIKRIKKENDCYYSSYVKKLCDSWGYGFVVGIQEAFAKQQEQNEDGWGLVLVTPKEVQEAAKDLGKEKFRSRAEEDISAEEFTKGLREGRKFDPSKRIADGGETEKIAEIS